MSGVAVVTDSVACLPQQVIDEYGIHIIPVRVTAGGKAYQDSAEELPPEVVRQLQETPDIDTTPWPPEHYSRHYVELGRQSKYIVHVVAFSQFTSTISLARAGADMAQEAVPGLRIELLDSATTTMAQGFIALAAARAAADGGGIEEVLEAADAVKARVGSIFALDTLRYLARTGRVNKLTAWASSALNVKPIVGLFRGETRPLGLVRSRSQSAAKLIKLLDDGAADAQPLHVAVMDVDRPQEAEQLSSSISDRFHPAELYQVRLTPATQAVAGSGLLGVAFYSGR